MKLLTLLLSILTIVCFAFACTPDSGDIDGSSGNGEQNQVIDDGKENNGEESNETETPEHTHAYVLKFDNNNHWEECECGDKKNLTAHSGGKATCLAKAICVTCKQEYGDIGNHSGGTATCSAKAVCTTCNQPYGELGNVHNYTKGKCSCGEYESTYYTEGLVFELDGETYKVTDYNGTATEIVIPSIYQDKLVASIGYFAFYNCSSLTSIEIPNSVTSIVDYAFAYCSLLTSIEIPNSVTSIGSSAFFGCSSLTSIEIPNSVTSIGNFAFAYCRSLTSITVDSNNANYKDIDGNLYSKDGKTLIQYAIGKTATSFTIPSTVTSIGNSAFYNCDSLTSIEIPNSVTSIGKEAFYNCRSLISIVIPRSVIKIDGFAFIACDSLTDVYYGGNADDWTGITIGSYNTELTNATRYYYVENESDLPIHYWNYWHYVDGVPTVWAKS
ncbi:MAG: leucine-rich repeat domain-containing protein [Clostridiales bacterium]|nr:leucine-rich repeat domain-containing protein [Clostridiales bacterium]